MISIVIELDRRQKEKLRELGRQAPYALSRALNRTAQESQVRVKGDLGEKFTIRGPWTAKGIRMKPSNKRHLTAQVGSIDRYMELQETGGDKTRHVKSLSIPYGARKTRTQLTRRSRWPSAMLRRSGYFIAPLQSGGDTMAVWQRFGRKRLMTRGGNAGKKKQPIRLMYVFDDETTVRPRLGLFDDVSDTVKRNFSRNFQWAYELAMSTAR